MAKSSEIPYRSGVSDVASLFILILFAALALQFWGRISAFAPLRSDGTLVEGRWVDRYREPQTGEYTAIYRFEVDDKIYRGRQYIHEDQYNGDGQSVAIIYSINNPELSRISGTEGIVATDVVMFIATSIIVIFAVQFIFAYYTERAAWILLFRHRITSTLTR